MDELKRLRQDFTRALLSLDRVAARGMVMESAQRFGPTIIAEQLVSPVLEDIGSDWEEGKLALSQVYMAGRICEDLVDAILPPADPRRKGLPKMAIVCLEDHHRLGKRIVYSVLRAGGFELLDYGHGVEVDDLVSRTAGDGVAILLISVLMLRSALRVKDVRAGLDARAPGVRLIVGGAPFVFDSSLWQEVGADAMGKDASEALELVVGLTGGH